MQGVKLVNSKDRIEDKVEVDNSSRIDIPEGDYGILASLREDIDELDKARRESGRLNQVLFNLIKVCNDIENRTTSKREELMRKVGIIGEGRWVIDFGEKAFFRVMPGSPRVV